MYDLIKCSFQSNLEKKIITLQENSKVKYINAEELDHAVQKARNINRFSMTSFIREFRYALVGTPVLLIV